VVGAFRDLSAVMLPLLVTVVHVTVAKGTMKCFDYWSRKRLAIRERPGIVIINGTQRLAAAEHGIVRVNASTTASPRTDAGWKGSYSLSGGYPGG